MQAQTTRSGVPPMAIAEGEDFSPLAWELALRGRVGPCEGGGVCVFLTLLGKPRQEVIRGCGPTTTEAARSLARKLDHWVSMGVWL